jgi:hypothetical protein
MSWHAVRIAVVLERETSLFVQIQRLLDRPAEVGEFLQA